MATNTKKKAAKAKPAAEEEMVTPTEEETPTTAPEEEVEDDEEVDDDDSDEDESEDDPEAERAAAAELQNLPPGSVPEQRPQASQQTDPSDSVSDLTKRLREAGADPNASGEAMPQEAYDRANSDEQKAQAARESKNEAIMMGNTCVATEGPHKDRVFAVTRVVSYQDIGGLVNNLAGDPDQLYSHPKEVEVTAIGDERDGERLVLNVIDNGLEKQNEAVRGTRAGRRH